MPHSINIHDGTRLFLVRGKRTRHEVFAERGKPAKIMMPISEAGFLEVEKPADPPGVVHNEIVASEITVEERAVRRRDRPGLMGIDERERAARAGIDESTGRAQDVVEIENGGRRQAGSDKGVHLRSGQCAVNSRAEGTDLDRIGGAQRRIFHDRLVKLKAAPSRHSCTETHVF